MGKTRQNLLIIFLCAYSGLCAAETTADPWLLLEKAAQAAHKLSYKGIFVYQAGANVSAMQITHLNYDNGEFARLVSLDGAPREVLRHDNEVLIYNQKNEQVVIEKRLSKNSFPAILPGLVDALKSSYDVHVAGQERVGGRDCQIIHLEPRDHYRYGYRFSVDREFGLLLKSVMLNEHNAAIEQTAFNQLTMMYGTSMDWFRPGLEGGKSFVMQPQETVTPGALVEESWTLAPLPAGYRKIEHMQRQIPGKPFPVSHLVFSDGLASVSMFIEPLNKNVPPKIGYATQGATNILASVSDGYQLIVVGEVPEVTVRKFSAAISFKK